MDISDLPRELLEEIAEYLSLDDLLTCMKVSSTWGKAFDYNRIWKRFRCYHPNYFDHQSELLLSRKEEDEEEGCEERLCVQKEYAVKKNLSQGVYTVMETECGTVYCDNLVDFVDEIGNHWLLLSCMDNLDFEAEHKLQIWNLNNHPVLHCCQVTPFGKTRRLICTTVKMIEDTFYYICCESVLVYKFSYPNYELKFMHEVMLKPLKAFPERTFKETAMVCFKDIILGFFFTNQHIAHSVVPFVHAWDKEGTLIFKRYGPPFLPDSLADTTDSRTNFPSLFVRSDDFDKAVVAFQRFSVEDSSNIFTVLVFDVSRMCYTDFSVQKRNKKLVTFDISGEVVCVVYLKVEDNKLIECCSCYNVNNGQRIFKAFFSGRGDPFYKFIPGSKGKELVVIQSDTVIVLDLVEEKEVNRISFKDGKFLRVTLMMNDLMVLEYDKKGAGIVTHEMYNYRTCQKLYEIKLGSELGFEQSYYRFCFLDKYRWPPKLIAFKDPITFYAHNNKCTKIVVISFW